MKLIKLNNREMNKFNQEKIKYKNGRCIITVNKQVYLMIRLTKIEIWKIRKVKNKINIINSLYPKIIASLS